MAKDNPNKFVFTAKYKGVKKTFSDNPLSVLGDYECPYCKEEITIEQVKEITSLSSSQEKRVKDSLVYLNKYREKFRLDSCLRKTHFIAQVLVETNVFKATTEGGSFFIGRLKLIHGRYFKSQAIDQTILDSLKTELKNIIKITDKDGKTVTKTNDQISSLIKNVTVDVKLLYAKHKGDDFLIKTVTEKKKDEKGVEKDEIKYKIYIKKHSAFPIQTLSRAYAGRLGNGDELSRDGYLFRGKGLKQLTGRANYKAFSDYRNKNPFTDDNSGNIDFTKVTDRANLKCNSDKISSKLMYGVQSAIWYWNTQNGHPYKDADKDDVKMVTKRVNGGFNGLEKRSDYTIEARCAFNTIKHYDDTFTKGSRSQKDNLIHNLRLIKEERKVVWQKKTLTIKADPEGVKLWEKHKAKPIGLKPQGIKE